MTRREDWPELFVEYVGAREATPFAWGEHDCVLFAADWVKLATGTDPVAEFRRYKSATGAARKIESVGGLLNGARRLLPEIGIGLAARGDVALAVLEGRETLMLVEGVTIVGPGDLGLVRLPRAFMSYAFKV